MRIRQYSTVQYEYRNVSRDVLIHKLELRLNEEAEKGWMLHEIYDAPKVAGRTFVSFIFKKVKQ